MKNYFIIGVAIIILLCNCSKTKQDIFKNAIRLIPKEELPDALLDYLNNNKNIELTHPFDSTRFLQIGKIQGCLKQNVSIILQKTDSVENNYLIVVEHLLIDSIVCCNQFKSSKYSVVVYQIRDTNIKNITDNVFPKEEALLNDFSNNVDFSKNPDNCMIMLPFVYPDSIIIKNSTDLKETYKFIWDKDGYVFNNYNSYACNFFTECKNCYLDKEFVNFYNSFANAMLNKDTIKLKELTYFPLKVNDSYYSDFDASLYEDDAERYHASVNRKIIDTIRYVYNLDEFFSNLSSIISYGTKHLYCMGQVQKLTYTDKIGIDSLICNYSLKYEGISFQVGNCFMSFVFTKLCNGYKFSGYNFYPIPIGGT